MKSLTSLWNLRVLLRNNLAFLFKLLEQMEVGNLNHHMQSFITTHGILHQHYCPHTPPQNGVAERKHRHITETAILLLCHSSLPLAYWFDAIATSTFLSIIYLVLL